MGDFFKAFFKGFNAGRDRARNKSYRRQDNSNIPVKLVEPSVGRTVTLEVAIQNDGLAQQYMDLLTEYAKVFQRSGASWTVKGTTIQIIFDDGDVAEHVRQAWRK